ncbi:hypothetical protein GQ600_8228 [Phytophthora cactorum]|nr:hypothetical protein GQ600_8228 [Phytophthora cactorum]
MEFTNKDLYYLLFTELSPNQARCNTCINVSSLRHPDYQELAAAVFRKGNRFGVTLPDQRTCEVFRWVEWCIRDRMPVSFCERPLVRKNAKMEPISAATLQKYLDALYGLVREHDIARFLLSDEESVHVEELLETLMDLNEVTKALQVSTLAMVGA